MGHFGATLAPYLFKTKCIPAWDGMGFTRRPHPMSDVSRILSAIERGDPAAAGQLLPLVYEELRRLAARKLAREPSGLTLQPTALVHEAYLRLVGGGPPNGWDGRGHFFAAAAEAMRRILVEAVRRRKAEKRGGGRGRADLDKALLTGGRSPEDVLELDDLLEQLAAVNAQAAELVKLRFFAGLTGDQAAAALGISPRAADSLWAYARAWLYERMHPDGR
jgi:RNA polymerase sigma factor (TIGR02999 family)